MYQSSKKQTIDKRLKDEQDTAFAFQEFIKEFQSTTPTPKTFIKSGGDANANQHRYYPANHRLLSAIEAENQRKALECARLFKTPPTTSSHHSSKPKSNLEALKEELQQRHRSTPHCQQESDILAHTTNLFLTSLNATLNEQDLMQIFGVYGPLASVKIMWPRMPHQMQQQQQQHQQQHRTSNNIGFVAFMSRKDSERAYAALAHRSDMKVSWGKPIDLPAQPIYIPPALVKQLLPAPYSGLPFNAQRKPQAPQDGGVDNLARTTVKVTIPLDKKVLCVIHRTIEFVVKHGPHFEALLMTNELNNSNYSFLYENKSTTHIYYRWKLFSILNGESPTNWSTKPFRMFASGSVWLPPIIPDYTKGMRLDIDVVEEETVRLSDEEQLKLIALLQGLTPSREAIAHAMCFCIERIAAARDVIGIITDSFQVNNTFDTAKGYKQIARLYLLSDILYNNKYKNNPRVTEYAVRKLCGIFHALRMTMRLYEEHYLVGMAHALRTRVMKILRAWEMWKLFTHDFLNTLEFCINKEDYPEQEQQYFQLCKEEVAAEEKEEMMAMDADQYFAEETAKHAAVVVGRKRKMADEQEGGGGGGGGGSNKGVVHCAKSKWETVDAADLQEQAMTSQRIHEMELKRLLQEEAARSKASRHRKLQYEDLRHVEMKVIRYQDDLESGKRRMKYARGMEEEVNAYRMRCIEKLTARHREYGENGRRKQYRH